jgi:hypothetical protein
MIELIGSAAYQPETSDYRAIVMWMKRPAEPEVIFTCEHPHPDVGAADACADDERRRRMDEHAAQEHLSVPLAGLTPGYDHITATRVPYYTGQLAVTAGGEAPDVMWTCPHRHHSAPAAVECAGAERAHAAYERDRHAVSVPAAGLQEVFEEICDWWSAQPADADVPDPVRICIKVVRRWPDRNWRSYAFCVTPAIHQENSGKPSSAPAIHQENSGKPSSAPAIHHAVPGNEPASTPAAAAVTTADPRIAEAEAPGDDDHAAEDGELSEEAS